MKSKKQYMNKIRTSTEIEIIRRNQMEILQLRNTMMTLKNLIENFNNRLIKLKKVSLN